MLSTVAALSFSAAAFTPSGAAMHMAPVTMPRVEGMPVVMSTQYTVDGVTAERRKKKNIDSNLLKGYTVGSRAPGASVNSGTRGAFKKAGGKLGTLNSGAKAKAASSSSSPAGSFGALVAFITLLAPFSDAVMSMKK